MLKDFDAIYFGAVGWPTVPDHVSLWGLRLQHHARTSTSGPTSARCSSTPASSPRCARPTTPTWTGSSSGRTARASTPASAAATSSARGQGNEVAIQSALFTEIGCERIIRFAFDLARTRPVKKVSSVTKSNAQQYGMVLWDDVFKPVAADYPDVETESVLVDAMAAKFVLHPEDLSVVVASNLNADILSDLGSALAGSLGLAASANLNPERRFPSMFEPVHGSAPDIAGQGIANPDRRHRQSAALMLEHFGLHDEAARRPAGHRRHHRRRAPHPRRRRHRHHRRGHRRDHRQPGAVSVVDQFLAARPWRSLSGPGDQPPPPRTAEPSADGHLTSPHLAVTIGWYRESS